MPFIFTMPKLSPTMEEGVITKWHKKEGEYVEDGELVLEIATDKATLEHNALDGGWLRKILIRENETAKINEPIAIFSEAKDDNIDSFLKKAPEAPAPSVKEEPQKTIPSVPTQKDNKRLYVSPLARKVAHEKGIDLTQVKGSGPGGRIVRRDLEGHIQQGPATKFIPKIASGTFEEIPLSPIRKVIAKRLQESKSSIPHYYLTKKIDALPIYNLREQLKNVDLSITFNDIIIRACALSLKKHPVMNAGFNSVNQTILSFKTIDISVAVSFESGLITPILKNADYKSLQEISIEVKNLVAKAKASKLQEDEYKGGSFCISNLGMFGLDAFTAVINPPQGAILAVGAIVDEPVVKNGAVIAGKTLILTLSVDHRIIDGAEAAKFLQTLQKFLENPASLLQ